MYVSPRKNNAYNDWSYIFSRCFSFSSRKNNPEFQRYTADPTWKDFEVFNKWYEENKKPDRVLKFEGFHFSPETGKFE